MLGFKKIMKNGAGVFNRRQPKYASCLSNSFWGYSSYFSFADSIHNLRNIGISAHIDSGKTTFTERVLYYAGRIGEIHEVRGSDNVGAKMDFMELEREKGITIQSAATHLSWKDNSINIIDTPGHVDFTIEVERALRVLDGAVLLLCGASGVQPQTLTVDKQMKRYNVPRIIFINKLDRMGANPWKCIEEARTKLSLNAAAVQIPIGLDTSLKGLVDLIKMKAIFFEGPSGEILREEEIPDSLKELAAEKRQELLDHLANVNAEIEDLYLNEKEISNELIKTAIRKGVLERSFVPVFMGSAYKNKGVQLALDGVIDYLPNPIEIKNEGFQIIEGQEEKIELLPDKKKPFVGLAFKLEENKFGQLTFIRVYQGKLRKGEYIFNNKTKKRVKVSRMVRMHANEMEDIQEIGPGEIFALFGIECASGDTFTEGDMKTDVNLTSMFVPQPVMSLSIKPTKPDQSTKFNKALNKFKREDPTFHVNVDHESEEIIISGMGELHLQIYAERMKREFDVDVSVGEPTVNYRETITKDSDFDYLHKKQSGGAGQYAKIIGILEHIPLDDSGDFKNGFQNKITGSAIPNEYIPAIERAYYDTIQKGPLTGYPVVNTRFILTGGQTHVVDSSANAFAIATKYAFRQAFEGGDAAILEPVMNVEISVPKETYSSVMAGVSKRRGTITHTETRGDVFIMQCTVPLSQMFGYATELRGITQGQGEYTMEYKSHDPVPYQDMGPIIEKYKRKSQTQEDEE